MNTPISCPGRNASMIPLVCCIACNDAVIPSCIFSSSSFPGSSPSGPSSSPGVTTGGSGSGRISSFSHADNAHVSEANNIYPKIFIVLLFQFISILLKKNRYLTSNIKLYFFTYSFQNCSSLSRSSVPSSLRKQPIIASITVLTPL